MRSIIEQGREDAHGNQLHQLRGLPVTAEQKEQRTRNADTEHVDRGENTYTVHHEWATTSSQLIEWEWDMRAKEKQGAGRRRAGDLSWVSLRILVSGRTLGKCLCYPPSKSRPNKHSNSQPASQPAGQVGVPRVRCCTTHGRSVSLPLRIAWHGRVSGVVPVSSPLDFRPLSPT